MLTLSLKYRLYPSKGQERLLNETLEACRRVYNSLLNWRKHDYEVLGKSPSRYDQQKAFPKWSKEFPEFSAAHSQVLQNVAVRVDLAFRAYFRRVEAGEKPGYPRFKGEGQYNSFCYPQSGFSVGDAAIRLSKIGQVKANIHRPVIGAVKTCCVRRQNGKWFVCLACEYEPEPLPASQEAVGLDAGLNSFLALSDGTFVGNPRFFRKDEKALAKAQRKLSNQKKGSHARKKARKVVSRIHERIRNRRHDFVHQTARSLVSRYGVIAVEKLGVRGMLGNHCLAKSISDAAWSMFRSVLTSKAESAGREVIAVNPAYTSQDCSACGYRPDGQEGRTKKKLSDRWHLCPMCGASLDRDTNAAINILSRAIESQRLAAVGAPGFSRGE